MQDERTNGHDDCMYADMRHDAKGYTVQAESVNNTFGRTVNPLNRKVTSGGSSGGESALIAFGGSPLGIGTDIVGLFLFFILHC